MCFKKGKQKDRVDEEDLSSLPNQPARNACGLDGQYQLEMPSHIEEPKYKWSRFKHTEVATHACSVIFNLSIYVPLVFRNILDPSSILLQL